MMRKESGSNSLTFFVTCLRGLSCLCGRLCLRAGTSDRCAPAVLSLPPLRGGPLFTKPRAATPSEVPAHPAFPGRGTMLRPLGCWDCSCFDLFAASIRKSGLEIKNRCTVCPCFDFLAASIRKSGPEIKNRCTVFPCFGLLAASIRKSGLEIKNRCTDCPSFDLLAASIRKSGPEIENRCTDCPCFDLFAASIRKSGLEIENRCTDCPGFDLFAASIRKSGPEIRNHCSAIVPASRMARLRKAVAATLPRPILFFFAAH